MSQEAVRMYYAQRGEDRRLHQLLGDKPDGFYIDVGAWEPTADSVTKHFYDRGWSGINIDPVRHYYDNLVAERPRDVNLNVAVGEQVGELPLYVGIGTGLSTFVPEYGEHLGPQETVHVTTLRSICDVFVRGPIDFLKIDVEGFEREVIMGGNWTRYRPTFLCIEATRPGTDIPAWDTWDHLVIERGYDFMDFDSLNRWYRAR